MIRWFLQKIINGIWHVCVGRQKQKINQEAWNEFLFDEKDQKEVLIGILADMRTIHPCETKMLRDDLERRVSNISITKPCNSKAMFDKGVYLAQAYGDLGSTDIELITTVIHTIQLGSLETQIQALEG